MLKLKLGAVVLAAVFAGAFSPKAEAFMAPSYACTAANQGEVAYTWRRNTKFEWHCENNQWVFMLQWECNQYGNNCIPY